MRWQENFILWLLRIIIEFIQPQDFAIVHFHWFSYKGFIWIYLTTQWKKVIDLILILIHSKSMPWSKQSQVSPEFCMPKHVWPDSTPFLCSAVYAVKVFNVNISAIFHPLWNWAHDIFCFNDLHTSTCPWHQWNILCGLPSSQINGKAFD